MLEYYDINFPYVKFTHIEIKKVLFVYDKKMMKKKTEELLVWSWNMHQGQNELKNKINKHEEPNHLQK